jgi:GntR family transcriptional regulator/MocR family aminotransferase
MLRPGQRVPSTRGLAEELGVSRLPVLTAYEQLLHEGYFEGRVGSGTFVCDIPPDIRLRPHARLRSAPRLVNAHVPVGRDEGGVRPFRATLPALDEFPHVLWTRIVARQAHRLTPAQLAYGDPAGSGALRAAIAPYLRTARAVNCEGEDVLITSGSQAALRISAAVVLDRGSRVAMEDPGYPGARAAFEAAGATIVPIPVDDEGIDVNALASIRRSVRAVYVTPSHQFPLGMAMSAARRMALLEWAARHDAWILEDDYDSEYRYVSRPLPSLQGMDSRKRVIYIGTFSKVIFPSLRVGYLVVPRTLRERFLDARDAFDICSASLYEAALTEFLNEGHFARHVRRMRGVYSRRRDALVAALIRYCDGVLSVANADAGLHVTTFFDDQRDDRLAVRRLRENGLTAVPLSLSYATRRRRTGLLLGLGGFDERALTAATRALAETLRGEINS